MPKFKVITFCFGLSMTVALIIACVEVDLLRDHLPFSLLLAYGVLALTVWPVARHSETLPLGRRLRRFAFRLWVLSIVLIPMLFWVTLTTFIVLMVGYGAAFLLFVIAVIRYYRKNRDEFRNCAE